ncbi:MAG: hypothetical protein KF824_06180 [Fimbriimonadaceae bacterium]|nr:MAG: hypothetical protein KF824_06180 [Fimbriimonadaceae bacterium]
MPSHVPISRWIIYCIVLITVLGCKSESIAGKWSASDGRPFTLKFNNDETMVWEIEAMGQSMEIPGKYTYSRGELKITELTIPPMLAVMMKQAPVSQDVQIPTEMRATVTYKNATEIVINGKTAIDGAYKLEKQ